MGGCGRAWEGMEGHGNGMISDVEDVRGCVVRYASASLGCGWWSIDYRASAKAEFVEWGQAGEWMLRGVC